MRSSSSRFPQFLFVILSGAALAACGGGGSDSDGSKSSATGRVKLSLTDAPVDQADEIWVQFRAVEFKPENGEPVLHEFRDGSGAFAPRRVNLLPLQDGRTTILIDDLELEAGNYQWLRLIVDNEPNVRDSYLMVEGNECELRIPSGDESGLKLVGGFALPENGSLALTVDFDLRKSIRRPPGQQGTGTNCTQAYLMKPVLRLVRDSSAGAITGTVAEDLRSPADCARLVYVFADGDRPVGTTPPDDQDANEPNPVTMARVNADTGAYRASFLPAGNYTLAFTCSPDDMDADDALTFSPAKGATVQANAVTSGINFP